MNNQNKIAVTENSGAAGFAEHQRSNRFSRVFRAVGNVVTLGVVQRYNDPRQVAARREAAFDAVQGRPLTDGHIIGTEVGTTMAKPAGFESSIVTQLGPATDVGALREGTVLDPSQQALQPAHGPVPPKPGPTAQ